MSEGLNIGKLLDSTRASAQSARLDMGSADGALDAIRCAAVDIQSPFDIWAAIDQQIGEAKEPALRQQLIDLRTSFEKEMFSSEADRVRGVFDQGADAGWEAWVNTLAEGITRFRFGFCTRLCEHSFPFQESRNQNLEKIREAVRCMNQGRWPEAYEQLDWLAAQECLPGLIRARVLVILGQIQLFHFQKTATAKELFDSAERLAPDDPKVLSGLGDYWLGENNGPNTKSYYERAIELGPGMPSAYTGLGEYFEKQNDLGTAEDWYKKAISAASGDSLGYSKLFKLYGRPELFKAHEADLADLLERAIAVDSECEYQMYLDCGYTYEQNQDYEKAQKWYERAIALDVSRPGGYASLAMLFEKQQLNDQAEAAYKKGIEVAPQCYDGYWGLTWLYEQQEKWQDAMEWYQNVPQHRKEWSRIARAKVGEMLWKLEHYDEAARTLGQELQADRGNETARNMLQTIGDEYYQQRGDREAARRVYDDLLQILQDSYRADYHNRLGNLMYFYDENSQAAGEYRLAIAANPDNAVFHRNLAGVYKDLKDYGQAGEELQRAFELDGDTKTLNKELALLANASANDLYARGSYSEAIKLYDKAITHDPGNDVIQSNLAGAWEHLIEPGRRLEALNNAIEAIRRAQQLTSEQKYEKDIVRLNRKKEFTFSYGERVIDWLQVVTPIAMEVADDLVPYTEGSTEGSLSDVLARNLLEMRTRIQTEFGVKLPGVRFRGNEADLPAGTYIIMIMEIPLVSGSIAVNQRFLPGQVESKLPVGVNGVEPDRTLTNVEGLWINQQDWKEVEEEKLELWDVIEYPIRHLETVVKRNLVEFLGHQEVAEILEAQSRDKLIQMRNSPGKLTAFTTVCRALLAEGVPITPLPEIYDVFDRLYSERSNPQDVVESIRSLPGLCSRLPGNDNRYSVLHLSSSFEAEIRSSIYEMENHSLLAIEPERCQRALTAFRNGIGDERNIVVVVDDPVLRPFVRLLIEIEFPNVPVLARQEVRTDIEFKSAGSVELDEDSEPPKSDFRNPRIESSNSNHETRPKEKVQVSAEIGITVFFNPEALAERAAADDKPVEEMFSMMQDGLFYELGIVVPQVNVDVDRSLIRNEFRFKVNGHVSPKFPGLEHDEFLVNDTVDRLKLLSIEGREAVNPANGNRCTIVRENLTPSEMCRDAGLSTWGPMGFLVLTLAADIRNRAATFQTVKVTQYILDSLRSAFPELIDTALNRFTVEEICLVLRDLLDEEISIRDLRSILESMLSVNGTTDVDLDRYIVFSPRTENLYPTPSDRGVDDLTTADYSNFVRTSLKSYISHKYTRGGGTLIVYLLGREIERRIGNIESQPLTSEEGERLIAAFRNEVGSLPATAQYPVLLTTMDIRRKVRKLIEKEFPNLAVLSYQELSPDTNIQPIARISWT